MKCLFIFTTKLQVSLRDTRVNADRIKTPRLLRSPGPARVSLATLPPFSPHTSQGFVISVVPVTSVSCS